MTRFTEWLFGKPSAARGDVFAALDIGSSKIACLIARMDEQGQPQLIGVGHQLAEGMRNGIVADMESARRALSAAVVAAEKMAGETLDRVIVNVPGPLLQSQTEPAALAINGREISGADILRLKAQGLGLVREDAQGHVPELIHILAAPYSLDGQKGIRDPMGMTGYDLQAQLLLVAAPLGPVRTLCTTVAKSHLEVERLVAAPYASGLACLVEDEMDLGCALVDIGAGTTSVAIFYDGALRYADGLALGGAHITGDIARGFTTTFAHAERLKTLFGSAILAPTDERATLEIPQMGEESPDQAASVPRAELIRIIQPRLEEIFELVRAKLEKSGLSEFAGRRLVLTGGTSQMPGIREMAERLMDKKARLGKPLRITPPFPPRSTAENAPRPTEASSGPSFSTAAGLLAVALNPDLAATPGSAESGGTFFGRLSAWSRQAA